jgi:hypothetical protein
MEPPLEWKHVLSLRDLCQHTVAKTVNMKNAVKMYAFAEDYYCEDLAAYCGRFIQRFVIVLTGHTDESSCCCTA